MISPDEELRRLVYDLRQVVNRLAKVEDPSYGDITLQKGASLRGIITSPEQTRANAWLAVIEQLIRMQPGDTMTVEWHDSATHPYGHLATLTYRSEDTAT